MGSDSGAPRSCYAKFQELAHRLRFQGRPPSASLFLLPSSGSVTSLGILREPMNDSESTILLTITEQYRLGQNNTEESGTGRDSMRRMEKRMNVRCGEEGRLGKERENKHHQTQGIQIHFSKGWFKLGESRNKNLKQQRERLGI